MERGTTIWAARSSHDLNERHELTQWLQADRFALGFSVGKSYRLDTILGCAFGGSRYGFELRDHLGVNSRGGNG